jgi:PKD repeat protein
MNPTHYYSTAGEYVVILSVVDEHGISNTNTTTITVNVSG